MKPFLISTLVIVQAGAYATTFLPHTDPGNQGNWVLQEQCSDEFEGTAVDHNKWQVCGKDGTFWAGSFKGRGYAEGAYPENGSWQYSPDNVLVSNGLLRITTKYEPDYPFIDPTAYDWKFTTGGIWSKAESGSTGYMEIRCKLDYEEQTGAFWTTGNGAELDVFEAIGKHATREKAMWSSVHDWNFGSSPNNAWTDTKNLSHNFTDGFHTYAAEWNGDYVKIYADGVLIHHATRENVESGAYLDGDKITSTRWPLTGGQHIWADSEIFPWWGVPDTNNPPSDFEVDYIRVWEKSPGSPPAFEANPINKNGATEGALYNGSISTDASDPDGNPITFTKLSGPDWLQVSTDGTLSGTPITGHAGNNTFMIEVQDFNGGTDSATLNIAVNAGPRSDYASKYGLNKLSEADSDGDSFSDWMEYLFGGDPTNAAISIVNPALDTATGNYRYQLRNDASIATYVLIKEKLTDPAWETNAVPSTMNDGAMETHHFALSTTRNKEFTRLLVQDTTPPNLAPAFTTDPASTLDATQDAGYHASLTGLATDPENDPLTYSKESGPDWLSVAADGTLSGTPTDSDVGPNSFEVKVSAAGGSDTATLNIAVVEQAATVELTNDDFETGTGNWVDPGNNTFLSTDHAIGTQCVYIRSNKDNSYTVLRNALNLTSYSQVTINFSSYCVGYSSGEGYLLQFSSDGGANWTDVRSFRVGTDFELNSRHNPSVLLNSGSYNFTSNALFRFKGNGNLNTERVYLDNIVISAQ